MALLSEEFKEIIAPFSFSEHNGTYSALLDAGIYQDDIFAEYFESKGIEGGGYSWDAIADLYIREQLPQYSSDLDHDSEASMFCLYSKSEEAVHDFLQNFKEYCDDEVRFRDLIERASFEDWD